MIVDQRGDMPCERDAVVVVCSIVDANAPGYEIILGHRFDHLNVDADVALCATHLVTYAYDNLARSRMGARCDECDPSFGCFDGSAPCSKRRG